MTVMDINSIPESMQSSGNNEEDIVDKEFEEVLTFLSGIKEIYFKSQQRGEADLSEEEKIKIGRNVFCKSKLQFLIRFGDFLLKEHLEHFKKFTYGNDDDSNDINIILRNLEKKAIAMKKPCNIKNRRYEALKELIAEGGYFSEVEMMKRNPLLYEQLVGQYLSKEEIVQRDKFQSEASTSFVKILMEGIDREDAEVRKQKEEEYEENMIEESDSDSDNDTICSNRSRSPINDTKLWGEFTGEENRKKPKPKRNTNVTSTEKDLLKGEFITTMYHNFLDGSDKDFDYSTVDCNSKYDSIQTIDHDEEDKYFDSEEPAIIQEENLEDQNISDDDLDVYMSALHNNIAVRNLTHEMRKVKTDD